ncbi:MAG: hypothetical protein M1549_03155 [Candidatus Dependentiae bacterium]|nr:hypothetical protein [Candidatus Dependentiae bacterium]
MKMREICRLLLFLSIPVAGLTHGAESPAMERWKQDADALLSDASNTTTKIQNLMATQKQLLSTATPNQLKDFLGVTKATQTELAGLIARSLLLVLNRPQQEALGAVVWALLTETSQALLVLRAVLDEHYNCLIACGWHKDCGTLDASIDFLWQRLQSELSSQRARDRSAGAALLAKFKGKLNAVDEHISLLRKKIERLVVEKPVGVTYDNGIRTTRLDKIVALLTSRRQELDLIAKRLEGYEFEKSPGEACLQGSSKENVIKKMLGSKTLAQFPGNGYKQGKKELKQYRLFSSFSKQLDFTGQ